ncbi:hypothetical protein AMECASPLE_003720 [Ameca splendens]|uniref:Uncharacterized protein n=1 Tax=Ameca splendens TaxID=208324 RepID=A0ABV0Y9P8_9TELE
MARNTFTHRGETPVGSFYFLYLYVLDMCEVQGSVSRCKLYNGDKARHCDGSVTVSMLVQRRRTWEASCSSEGHAHSAVFLSEPKQPCFTHRDRQYTDRDKH